MINHFSSNKYRVKKFLGKANEMIGIFKGLKFVLFATEMGWVGEHLDEDRYPTVVFIDEYGKKVGINSSQGVEIYSSR